MRVTIGIALLALGLMALGSATASAQVEVIQEDNGNAPCPAVSNVGGVITGGCPLHGAGEFRFSNHTFGIEAIASECHVEFVGRIAGNGEAWVYEARPEPGGHMNCNKKFCQTPFKVHKREAAGVLVDDTEMCLEPLAGGGAPNKCYWSIPFVDSGDHDYAWVANDLAGMSHAGPACEVTTNTLWEGGGLTPGIEVVH
jgi:hypothetical protein